MRIIFPFLLSTTWTLCAVSVNQEGLFSNVYPWNDSRPNVALSKPSHDFVSSFGLRNCFCKGCNTLLTVGKVYNGVCYFMSRYDRVQTNKYNRNVQVIDGFQVANVTNEHLAIVLMQVSSEMYVTEMFRKRRVIPFHSFKLGVAFYTANSESISLLKPELDVADMPDTCPTLWIGEGKTEIDSECRQRNIALLEAGRGQYFALTPHKKPEFEVCDFDSDALSYSVNHCIKAFDMTQSCDLANINNMHDLESIHAYLVSLTQGEATDIRKYATYFKIGNFNERLFNRNYSLLLDGDAPCKFVDVQGKRILRDECDKPHRKICLRERPPGENETAPDEANGEETTTDLNTTVSDEQTVVGLSTPVKHELTDKLYTRMDHGQSSFGLQSCFCVTCNHEKTVGKVYDGACYFITTNKGSRFKLIDGNRDRHVRLRYKPAIINGTDIATVFKQVTNEFYLKHYETEIGFYVDEHHTPRDYLKPVTTDSSANRCYVYDASNGLISKECARPFLVFMRADRGQYYSLPRFQPEPYEPCSFDSSAMAMVGRPKYCIKASESHCEYKTASIYPRNFGNLHKYLTNLSQPSADNLSDFNSSYRIKMFKLKNNAQREYNKKYNKKYKCTFIDVQSKQVNSMICKTSVKRLCEIKRPETAMSSKQTSSYGLRNCICDSCNPVTTVGKLYNGQCYFASMDSEYKMKPSEDNFNVTIAGKYAPVAISEMTRIRVLQQLTYEFWNVLEENKLAFYVDDKFNISGALVPAPDGQPEMCMVYDRFTNRLTEDCQQTHSVLYVANENDSIVYDEYVPKKYNPCWFDSTAINLADNYCLKLSDAPCEKLQTDRIFDNTIFGDKNVMRYLIAMTQPQANDLGYLNLTVRLDNVNFDKYSNLCSYFDLQSKTSFGDSCYLPAKLNLCAVTNNHTTEKPRWELRKLPTSPNETKSSRNGTITVDHEERELEVEIELAIYLSGASAAFVIILLLLYCVIRIYVRKPEDTQ